MPPTEVREAVRGLPLTQAQIAERIGVSHGHLRNVLAGSQELGKAPSMLLALLLEEYDA